MLLTKSELIKSKQTMKTILTIIIALSMSLSAYSQSTEKVAIYRWNYGDDWVDARDDEGEKVAGYGYKNKTFVCYLFKEPQAGTVAINRWNFDKDWATATEDESAKLQG